MEVMEVKLLLMKVIGGEIVVDGGDGSEIVIDGSSGGEIVDDGDDKIQND